MPKAPFSDVLQYLRKVCAAQAAQDLSDPQLLNRFIVHHEDAAFTVLVQRHGPMILGVCQRVLGDVHQAEDCLQATFMVLVRRAASLRLKASLGTWLYAVAQRVAVKARAQGLARRQRERRTEPIRQRELLDELTWQELRGVLDEEIAKLPEKYQAPLVLCYLEGKSQEQAAKELGWPKNSLPRRIDRARELLRQRLVRRGVALSAGVLATALGEKVSGAPVGAMLVIRTVKAAASMAAGKALAAGPISAGAVALAEEAMKGMFAISGKMLVVLLGLGLAFGGVGTLALALHGAGGIDLGARSGPSGIAGQPAKQPKEKLVAQVQKQPATVKEKRPTTDVDGNPLPENALARLGSLAFYDGRPLDHVVVSPDGATLATSGFGVRLWDAKTGRQLSLPDEYRQEVYTPFAAGDKILTVERHNVVKGVLIRDLKTGKELARFAVSGWGPQIMGKESYAVSPDGKTLVIQTLEPGLNRAFRFCDLGTGKVGDLVDLKGKQDNLQFAFSGDSKTLIIVASDSVQVWDVASQSLRIPSPDNSADFGYCAAVSFDGKLLANAPQNDTRVRMWDTATLKELPPLLDQPKLPTNRYLGVQAIAFSPEGEYLAVCYSMSSVVRLWDLASRKEVRQFRTNDITVQRLTFFPDGKTLAAVDNRSVTMWDVATGTQRGIGHICSITGLAFSGDGKTLVTSAGNFDDRIRLWDPVYGRQIDVWSGHTSGIGDLALSPDGKLLASSSQDKSIRVWDFRTGKVVRTIPAEKGFASGHSIYSQLAFSPDGKSLYRGRPKKGVQIWDVSTGNELEGIPILADRLVVGLAFGPDEKMLAVAGQGLSLWDLAAKKMRWELGSPSSAMPEFDFSPDGKYLSMAVLDLDNQHRIVVIEIRIIEAATGRTVRTLSDPPPPKGVNPHWFTSVAYSPDGRMLAAGQENGLVRLWEVATWKERAKFDGHRDQVHRLAFSPNGSMLASGGDDRTVMVWDIAGKKAALVNNQVKGDARSLMAAWGALASPDTAKAYAGIKEMITAGSAASAFLDQHLVPAVGADDKVVAALITKLDSEQFAQRDKAARELKELGDRAEYALEAVAAGQTSLELRRRAEGLLELLQPIRSPERLRALRAVEVLEHIGTPEARRVLERLSQGGPRVRLTQDAKASVLRLKKG